MISVRTALEKLAFLKRKQRQDTFLRCKQSCLVIVMPGGKKACFMYYQGTLWLPNY